VDAERETGVGRPRGRLQTRLTLITAALVLGAASASGYLFRRLSVESLEHVRYRAASDVAESIALRLAAGVPRTAVLDRVLQEYVHAQSEIVAASVVIGPDPEKAELRSAAGMNVDRSAEQDEALRTGEPVARVVELSGERFWSVAVPIAGARGVVGVVGVWSTLQAIEDMNREIQRLALFVLPGALGALVLLLSLAFRYEVHGPMEALRQAMIRAEGGDLAAEAPVVRSDEIGFIASQYNKMLSRLRANQEEREEFLRRVQGFNEELSSTVARATAELKARNEELERVNRELYLLQRRLVLIERRSVAQQMTARLAHKIGTPLNLISGHVQILKRSRESDRELQDKLELIQSQIEKLTDTVQDTLDETRASTRREPLAVNRLLENISALLRPTLAARGVELALRLDPKSLTVDGVEDQLEQVFLTLINNSLDAMPNGGRIDVRTDEEPPGAVRVTLHDNGEGIPEHVLPRIFQPFFTTKEQGRGTGLGLSIVQEILAAHRATVRVESRVDQGTTFTVVFPGNAKTS
jgi:signal transduction histidine kinase